MTSAFHFMGPCLGDVGNRIQLEPQLTLAPPQLMYTVYFTVGFTSYSLISERFDFKARAH